MTESEAFLQYATVDVFTSLGSPQNSRFSEGNPLAIVRVPSNGSQLTKAQMQLIAREFNYSETTFLHEASDENCFKLDIFMTYREIPFAGHPTIGSAVYALQNVAQESGLNSVKGSFMVKAGKIELEYDATTKLAKAGVPHNFHVHQNSLSPDELFKLQPNLKDAPVSPSPIASPVRGMTFALVSLPSLESLATVQLTPLSIPTSLLDEEWASFAGQYFYHITGEDPANSTTFVRTRMITEWEDPGTGSAACTLACHLALHDARSGENPTRRVFEITQGVEMGRKCVILVEIQLDLESKSIEKVVLSGRAVQVMDGRVRVPVV